MKIRNGDTVIVITGKDKGKTGTVLRILPDANRVVVADINMRTRHVKATAQSAGQKITYEASLDASNVMLVDPKTKKPTRIGLRFENKKKVRFAKSSGETLPNKNATTTVKKKSKAIDAVTEKPKKEGFWKKSKAIEDPAAVKEPTHMQENHSIPAQIERKSTRSHTRGS